MSNPTEGLVADLPSGFADRPTRESIVLEVMDECQDAGGFHDDDGGISSLDEDDRYLLVERNYRYGCGFWLTSVTSDADAGNYHVNQEYAEDWELILLVDLDTGQRFKGRAIIDWYPVSGDFGAVED
jgi:hypothetical protein